MNISCEICNNQQICIVNNLFIQKNIEVEVKKCPYFNINKTNDSKNHASTTNNTFLQSSHRGLNKINEISDKIKTLTAKNKGTCPNCSTDNVELTTCAKCGKTICEACETFELSDNKSYCSSCYSE